MKRYLYFLKNAISFNKYLSFYAVLCMGTFISLSVPCRAYGKIKTVSVSKNITLEFLIKKAMGNPRISSSYLKAQGSKEDTVIAKALPEPIFSLGFTNANGFNDPELGVNSMSNIGFSLTQKIPFPSKLKTKSLANKYSYLSLAEKTASLKTVAAFLVKRAYYGLALVEEQIKIVKYDRMLLDVIIKDGEKRYGVGTASADAYIRPVLEDASLKIKLTALRGDKSNIVDILSELTGINQSSLEEKKAEIPKITIKPYKLSKSGRLPVETIKAYNNNPSLKSLKFSSKKAYYEAEYAKEQYLPDFYLKLGYGDRYSMQPVLSASVGISIPVYFNGYQEPLIEKTDKYSLASVYDVNWEKLRIKKELNDAYSDIKTDTDNYFLYRKFYLPEARLLFKTEMSSFGVNRSSAFSLIDSFRKLVNAEFKMDEYRAKYFIDESRIKLITGAI